MTPKIDISNLFMNRYPLERAIFHSVGNEYFDDLTAEEEGGNRLLHEESFEYAIEKIKNNGNAIFAFRSDLVALLAHTDVLDTPINKIRLPYEAIYCHLGDSNLIPLKDHRIDGFFISTLLSVEDLNDTSSEARIREIELSNWSFYRGVLRDSESEISRGFAREHLAKSVEQHVQDRLSQREAGRAKYREYCADPDAFFKEYNDEYLCISIEFTTIRKDGVIRPLTPLEIAKEPALSFMLIFPRHTSTVNDAFEYTAHNNHSEEIPCQYSRKELAKIAFNLICYLNWKDRDVVPSFSSDNVQKKVDRAQSDKERQRTISKAHSSGHRLINFCGYSTPETKQGHTPGCTVASHWRRGHWRNQPFGKGLIESRLTWIKPVIINKGEAQPTTTTVYKVEG